MLTATTCYRCHDPIAKPFGHRAGGPTCAACELAITRQYNRDCIVEELMDVVRHDSVGDVREDDLRAFIRHLMEAYRCGVSIENSPTPHKCDVCGASTVLEIVADSFDPRSRRTRETRYCPCCRKDFF